MFFDNCGDLQGKSVFTFERITTNFIRTELETTPAPPMQDLTVWTNFKTQKTVDSVRNLRILQQGSPTVIVFDTAVEFRSTATQDVPVLVGGTWDTLKSQEAFIAALQATNDTTFQDITFMQTEINAGTPENGGTGKDDDIMLYIIIGAAVGGGALLFLLALCIVYCRRRRRRRAKPLKKSALTFATQQPSSANGERISTYVILMWRKIVVLSFVCIVLTKCRAAVPFQERLLWIIRTTLVLLVTQCMQREEC